MTRCTYRLKPGEVVLIRDGGDQPVMLELARCVRGEATIRLHGDRAVDYRMMTPAESKAALDAVHSGESAEAIAARCN